VAAAVVLAAQPTPSPTADPDGPTGGAVTWAVQPADAHGPDGRRWVELRLDPGARVTEHLAVRNYGDAPVTFALSAADGYLTEGGRFTIVAGRPSVDAGTWIAVPDEVRVPAGGTAVVPFTVAVPRDATPGDHPAGVAASSTDATGTVRVVGRVGFRVMVRVTGALHPRLAVDAREVGYASPRLPWEPGRLDLALGVSNEGNVRLGGRATVETAGPFGIGRHTTTTEVGEILPGGAATVRAAADAWPLVRVTTTVVVTPVAVGAAEGQPPVEPVTVRVTTWAAPWSAIVALGVVVGCVWGLAAARRRRRARIDAMLDRAREEGRRAGAGRVTGGSGSTGWRR